MSTAAKVGIGCGIALLLAAIIAGIAVWQGVKWAKAEFGDFLEHPEAAIAQTVIKNHPDLELLESDLDAGTFTLKYKEDGKTYTTKLSDLQDGKIVLIDEDGNETVLGNVDPSKIPAWVPQPDSASDLVLIYFKENGEKSSGQYMASVSGTPEEIIAELEKKFPQEDGASNSSSKSNFEANGSGQWSAELKNGGRKVTVLVVKDQGQVQVTVNWNEE